MENENDLPELLTHFQEAVAQRDESKIINSVKTLAELGHQLTSADVAYLYEVGQKPVELSLELAFNWYKRSAYEDGDSIGYFGLGRFYFDGRYVAKDTNMSTQLFEKAAAMGCIEAHILAGFSYLGARGAKCDLQQAEGYLLSAAARGYVAAFFLLYRVAFARHKYLTAARFWLKSISQAIILSRKNKEDPKLYMLHGIWKEDTDSKGDSTELTRH